MSEQAARHVRILGPFAAGYFLSYLYRVVNAVMAPDLVADLGLGPSDLGLLTSVYFLTFAASQLPLMVPVSAKASTSWPLGTAGRLTAS